MIRCACICLAFAAACFAAALAGCGGGTGLVLASGTPVPTPTPDPTNAPHLYVEYTGTPGSAFSDGVAVYALPISSSSRPAFAIPGTFGPLAFDAAGNMYTTYQSNLVQYRAPLSGASSGATLIGRGAATIPNAANDIIFDQWGNLWMQTTNDLRMFPFPLTASSIATTISPGGGYAQLAISPSGTLYTGPLAPPFGASITLMTYGPFPYTVAKKVSGATFGVPLGWGPDGSIYAYTNGYYLWNNQFVQPGIEKLESISGNALLGTTLVDFDLPFRLYAGQNAAHPAAMNADGSLFVIDAASNNAVDGFNFPLRSSSKPAGSIACVQAGANCYQPTAVYLGP